MPSGHSYPITRSLTTAFRLVMVCAVFYSTTAIAQDSPGRFEVGGNFTGARVADIGAFGPGVEGDVNFGRHIALDGAYSWLPFTFQHLMTGFVGAKIGTRSQHFGFFGKIRPGFISFGNIGRDATVFVGPGPTDITETVRFGRQTEKALDFGGVVEYYPARHWALRWDSGEMLVFEEQTPQNHIITISNAVPAFTLGSIPAHRENHFQFSTGVHYRF
jgi:hypothetical protein